MSRWADRSKPLPPHQYVTVDYHDEPINIDVGIVDIIQGLWERDIATLYCCEGDDEPDLHMPAYITFAHEGGLANFIYLIFPHRITPSDWNIGVSAPQPARISVYFPSRDTKFVERIINRKGR